MNKERDDIIRKLHALRLEHMERNGHTPHVYTIPEPTHPDVDIIEFEGTPVYCGFRFIAGSKEGGGEFPYGVLRQGTFNGR